MNRKIIIVLFGLLALVQLYVPLSMIIGRERVIDQGTVHRIKTRPLDPNDPFRGKYVSLGFEINSIPLPDGMVVSHNENVYAVLGADDDGFAEVKEVRDSPPGHDNYLETQLTNNWRGEGYSIVLPFDRFYMEESKARPAETAYFESLRDTSQLTWALVHIKDGQAVLTDVLINGRSLKEIAEENIQK